MNTVPPWRNPTEQPRYLNDEGRLFFESYDALSPVDTNGRRDVYEFEPVGVGSCAVSSRGFGRAANGCIELVSSGTDSDDSFFFDASEGPRDAFVSTRQALLPEDVNARYDIYDARVGGGFPVAAGAQPACEGEACRPGAPAPAALSPGSAGRSAEGACTDLERRLAHAKSGAKKAARKVRAASSPRQARRLRKQSGRAHDRLRKLSKSLTGCRRRAR